MTTQKYFENGIIAIDLKVKTNDEGIIKYTTACICYRLTFTRLYFEIGGSLTLNNLTWESGQIAEQYLDTGLRAGFGFQFDFESISLDFKLLEGDHYSIELYRERNGDPIRNWNKKVAYDNILLVSLIYLQMM